VNKNTYLYIIIVFLAICLLFTCNTGKIKDIFNPSVIDTVITTKSDTVWAKDTVYTFKYKTIDRPVTVYLDTNSTDTAICDSIRVYEHEFNDSNLTVFTVDTTKGQLLGHSVSYKLKVPIRIIDSVLVNITETKKLKPKRKIFLGLNAQVYPLEPHISPMVTYQDRRDRMYHIQYDIITGGFYGGFSYKLSFRKK